MISENRVLLAGATGVIGRRLVPMLLRAGYQVFGTTRSANKAAELQAVGVVPLVLNVFDRSAVIEAFERCKPQFVIHQLTDLPPALDPAHMATAVAANARVRTEGTANLVAASLSIGVTRMVAQSIAWAYAAGSAPLREDDALDLHATGTRATTVAGIVALERAVLHSPPLQGVVLRYGQLYGPGTGRQDATSLTMPLHVDAAAWAALCALTAPYTGIFNVAEPGPALDTAKARTLLGWAAEFRFEPSTPGNLSDTPADLR